MPIVKEPTSFFIVDHHDRPHDHNATTSNNQPQKIFQYLRTSRIRPFQHRPISGHALPEPDLASICLRRNRRGLLGVKTSICPQQARHLWQTSIPMRNCSKQKGGPDLFTRQFVPYLSAQQSLCPDLKQTLLVWFYIDIREINSNCFNICGNICSPWQENPCWVKTRRYWTKTAIPKLIHQTPIFFVLPCNGPPYVDYRGGA